MSNASLEAVDECGRQRQRQRRARSSALVSDPAALRSGRLAAWILVHLQVCIAICMVILQFSMDIAGVDLLLPLNKVCPC